jgi:hypothetical protein
MASLDDILSVQKNGVVGIGNISTILRRTAGTNSSAALTASTLVVSGPGRLVSVSVVVAGSAVGGAYNSATTAGAAAANELYAIPNVIGVYTVGMEFVNGLVITPGSSQTVAVTYTPGA